MSDKEKFQKWLNETMTKKSLTNRKLSELSGVHNTTIGRIRNHGKSVTDVNVERLTRALNKIPGFEYPRELKGVPYKFVEGGRFKVYSNGVVYRKNTRGIIEEAPQHYSGRNRNYAYVSYSENGEQKHFSVHRLVGKAFIPNPENKPEINHIDSNPRNNDVSNLEWVTRRENTMHAYENGLFPTLENSDTYCLKCEVNPVLTTLNCSECNIQLRRLKEQLKTKLATREKYKEIDTNLLKSRYKRIVNSRKRGATLEEVGEVEGVTRERIRQLENRIFDNHPSVYLKRKKNIQSLKKKPNIVLNISAARSNSNYKQYEVAELLGVSRNTIIKYEKYESIMTVDKALKFCQIVGLSFNNIDFVGEASGK